MRIIAGKFRSRRLLAPPIATTRPTSDRARESIFNMISALEGNPLDGAHILDAFAGSGALGLEALSRGGGHVTFLEQNLQAVRALKENIANLCVESYCTVIMGDATKPPKARQPANFVFLDPPYDQMIEDPCLTALRNQGWIQSQTLIILETSAKRALSLPPGAALIDQRRYGVALVSFLKLIKE